MGKLTNPLETLKVVSPCSAAWDDMDGDDHCRFCHQCGLNVYNLSALCRSDAEAMIAEAEGNRCIRLYRRPDGTVITRDCPIGWRAMRRRLAWIGGCAAAVLVVILGIFGWSMVLTGGNPGQGIGKVNPFKQIFNQLFGPPMRPQVVMGAICIPNPPPLDELPNIPAPQELRPVPELKP